MKTLIKDAQILLPDGEVIAGSIAVTDNMITAVGDVPTDFVADKIIDGKDKFVVPGLVNAHTHASMTLLRSYADDMDLMEWLTKKIWPIEDKMTTEDIRIGAALAAVEMIKSGTTAFADMYGPYMDEVAKVVAESGLRAAIARGLIGFAADRDERLATGVDLYKNWHNAENGRITVMFAPHAIYTCPTDFLRKIVETAEKLSADIHIHMSETANEVDTAITEYDKRPFAYVESLGLLERGVLAAHCVWLDDEDFAIIKRHNVRVAHNPGSNLKLASGIAPVPRMLREGITVGLGTDGASSNNNLDMLEEIRLAALIHKVNEKNPQAVTAFEAVRMGTEGGAKAVGFSDVGRIETGYKADLVLFDLNDAAFIPRYNLVSLLAYSANSAAVDTVMVDGKVLMENRRLLTLDEEKIYFEARQASKRLTGHTNLR